MISAGLLMFRTKGTTFEVLLVHPGGPYFRNKDEGAWTIPKGEVAENEDLLTRAKLEFEEELGISVAAAVVAAAVAGRRPSVANSPAASDGGSYNSGSYTDLGRVKQKGGKTVHAWAFAGDLPPDFKPASNTFEIEWPPRSGKMQPFPEIDRASFFPLELARSKINPAQAVFLDRLLGCPEIATSRRREVTRPLFLFAPGAGAPSSHPWMQSWKKRLAAIGDVVTFDYAYMQQGERRPDRLPELIATHRQALADARQGSDRPAFLIGKSMGGRIGCHVALEEPVAGVICFGYPLCGGGDPTRLRDKVLRQLQTPILFVQGTRDPLCPLELLEKIRIEMTCPNSIHIVDGGDHSLLVLKRQLKVTGETQAGIDALIFSAIDKFVANFSGS